MKNKNLIALSGKKQSGKNTVASIIQYLIWKSRIETGVEDSLIYTLEDFLNNSLLRTNKSGYKQKSFAGKLKQIVSLLTGVPVEDLEKEEVKNSALPKEWWYYEVWKGGDMTGDFEKAIVAYPDNKGELFHWEEGELVKPTYRQVLQQLGTDLLRNQLHPNVHINALFTDYKENKPPVHSGNFQDENCYSHSECAQCKNEFYGYKRQFVCKKCHEKFNWFPKWILTDPRFLNEIERIKKHNGITIRIERNTELRFPELWNDFQNQNEYYSWDYYLKSVNKFNIVYHESETALDDYTEFDYVIHNDSDLESLIKKVRKILIKEKII